MLINKMQKQQKRVRGGYHRASTTVPTPDQTLRHVGTSSGPTKDPPIQHPQSRLQNTKHNPKLLKVPKSPPKHFQTQRSVSKGTKAQS